MDNLEKQYDDLTVNIQLLFVSLSELHELYETAPVVRLKKDIIKSINRINEKINQLQKGDNKYDNFYNHL